MLAQRSHGARGRWASVHNRAVVARTEAQISILSIGTLHLANPGRDKFNVVVDDVLTDRRQSEIVDVVDRLLAFRPTRIAVEALDSAALTERYERFRRGGLPLRRTEVEQIGFRIAAALTLSSIDAVDAAGEFWVPEIEEARANGRAAAAWSELEESGRAFVERCQGWLSEETVGQVLWRLNTPEELQRALAPYSDVLVRVATRDNDAGPRMAANWYARNLRILGKLFTLAGPGDRILLLFGHAHAAIFRYLLSSMTGVALADPLAFLPPPGDAA